MTWFVTFADFFSKTTRHIKATELPDPQDCFKAGGLALSGDLQIAETMRSVASLAVLDAGLRAALRVRPVMMRLAILLSTGTFCGARVAAWS